MATLFRSTCTCCRVRVFVFVICVYQNTYVNDQKRYALKHANHLEHRNSEIIERQLVLINRTLNPKVPENNHLNLIKFANVITGNTNKCRVLNI